MKNNRENRRSFLRKIGMLSGASALNIPIQSLLWNIVTGSINKAHAQSAGGTTKNYIQFTLNGAPSRWMFDQILTPYSSQGFISNGSVMTAYQGGGGRYTAPDYRTFTGTYFGETITLPHMWQFSIPMANGGTRPMTDLLRNFLCVRGIDTGNAAHDGSQELLHRPLGAVRSISSTQADGSGRPIPAYFEGPSDTFRALTGKSFVRVSGNGNRIERLMRPFVSSNLGSYYSGLSQVESEVQAALGLLESYSQSQHPGADILASSRAGVEEIVAMGLGDLDSQWDSLFNKYNSLINRSLQGNFQFINDQPIGTTENRDGNPIYQTNNENTYMLDPDMRVLINSNTNNRSMAAEFALAEYLLVNRLTHSITMNLSGLRDLTRNGQRDGQGYDEHNTGVMRQVLQNFFGFRAMAACLNEFIEVCKLSGEFNDTLIMLGGEFNRSARSDGSGSDHGDNSTSFSFFSGMVNRSSVPMVVGDVRHGSSSGRYSGSWGQAAANPSFGTVNMSHISATVAGLLEIPTPTNAAPAVLSLNNGRIVSALPRARQVPND